MSRNLEVECGNRRLGSCHEDFMYFVINSITDLKRDDYFIVEWNETFSFFAIPFLC